MTRRNTFHSLLFVLLLSCGASEALAQKPANDAVVPAPRGAWWLKRHQAKKTIIAKGDAELLMIGDSITHGWEGKGKEVWAEYYGDRKAVNLGYGGDRTQHVLWRLDNGEADGISPKLAVVMIGTNNARNNAPEETAAGITLVVERLREKLPKTKVLLLAVFPRGKDNEDALRKKNEAVNAIIAKLDDGEHVHYLNINDTFLQDDGVLSKEVMPDLLHPHAAGYKLWAEAMEPTLKKLLGDN